MYVLLTCEWMVQHLFRRGLKFDKSRFRDESFITSWGVGGGRLHFHVMYKIFYAPSNPTGKKISTPPRFMTKILVTPPPNSQYSSPQTQSLIFAININIATTYLKIVCLLWIAIFCASFHAHGDKVTKIIKGVLGLEPKDFWCWQGTRKAESTQIERTDIYLT